MIAQTPLHIRRFGAGPRPALALHCTLAHGGAWRGVGGLLGDALTLIAPDLPSHGESPPWDGETDLHDACTEGVLPLLTEPMDVIGHSFGATVALRLAMEAPEKVRSLTLIEPVLFAVAAADAPAALAVHHENAAAYMAPLEAGDKIAAARCFNREWGDGTRWADFPEKARLYMADRMPLVAAQQGALFDDTAHLLSPHRLAQVTMPVLLLQGARSPAIIAEIHRGLAARIPHATRATIAEAAHMLPLSHPRQTARAIAVQLEMAQEEIDVIFGD